MAPIEETTMASHITEATCVGNLVELKTSQFINSSLFSRRG